MENSNKITSEDKAISCYKLMFSDTEFAINDCEGIKEIEENLVQLKNKAIKYNKNKFIKKYLDIDEMSKDLSKKVLNAFNLHTKINELEDDGDLNFLGLVEKEKLINNFDESIKSKVTDMNFINKFEMPTINFDKSVDNSNLYKAQPLSKVIEEKNEEEVSK